MNDLKKFAPSDFFMPLLIKLKIEEDYKHGKRKKVSASSASSC